MAFLSGRVGFERFQAVGANFKKFSQKQIEILESNASSKSENHSADHVGVGFLGGDHLFDHEFFFEKNVINHALHFSIRIDSHQVPSSIRRAWLQMELNAMMRDSDATRPTKAQRQEANDAVEQRCEDEIRSGKYHKIQSFPMLWDARQHFMYFGTSSTSSVTHGADLLEREFGIELQRVSAGSLAAQWAEAAGKATALAEASLSPFLPEITPVEVVWQSHGPESFNFLGNEFLLWLWWYLDCQSDTFVLADETEVTAMLARTLSLECPLGEWGKETFTSESPVRLPEARQAIRAGKLPRKVGITLFRQGLQFEFVLQAETFSISGARIQVESEEDEGSHEDRHDDRIEAIRCLSETVDLLFEHFCELRFGKTWSKTVTQIGQWLGGKTPSQKSAPRKKAG